MKLQIALFTLLMAISNRDDLAVKIKRLKAKHQTDKQVADQLQLSIHQVGYIRHLYGISGHPTRHQQPCFDVESP